MRNGSARYFSVKPMIKLPKTVLESILNASAPVFVEFVQTSIPMGQWVKLGIDIFVLLITVVCIYLLFRRIRRIVSAWLCANMNLEVYNRSPTSARNLTSVQSPTSVRGLKSFRNLKPVGSSTSTGSPTSFGNLRQHGIESVIPDSPV